MMDKQNIIFKWERSCLLESVLTNLFFVVCFIIITFTDKKFLISNWLIPKFIFISITIILTLKAVVSIVFALKGFKTMLFVEIYDDKVIWGVNSPFKRFKFFRPDTLLKDHIKEVIIPKYDEYIILILKSSKKKKIDLRYLSKNELQDIREIMANYLQ